MMQYPRNIKLSSRANKDVINVMYKQVENLFKTSRFYHYTDHSEQHSLRVLNYISKLLEGVKFNGDHKKLLEDEKVILLSAALLHDIWNANNKVSSCL